jgi:hypothetical protein
MGISPAELRARKSGCSGYRHGEFGGTAGRRLCPLLGLLFSGYSVVYKMLNIHHYHALGGRVVFTLRVTEMGAASFEDETAIVRSGLKYRAMFRASSLAAVNTG